MLNGKPLPETKFHLTRKGCVFVKGCVFLLHILSIRQSETFKKKIYQPS